MRRLAALLLTSTTLLPSAFLLLPFPSPLLAQQPPATAPSPELAEAERLNQQVIQLYQQGKYAEAIPLAERTLAIREKVLGANHPDTATSLNNLAGLYQSQGRYGQVEPLLKRALAIRERQLGANHPDTALSISNLAELYRTQGRYGEAEPLYQRALAIRERQLGADHPDTATSLNNLAALYHSQGRYGEAESLYKRALAIDEHQLGADHPDTATDLNNLALLYRSQGRYDEAEPLYKRALAISERQLGADHPDTATSLNNLALLYRFQGRYGEAEPLYKRALAIRERQLGADHPDTANSLNNLAGLYQSQGRTSEAEPLYKRALAIRERQLGADHPNTASSLNSLAGLYRSQGRYAEAEPLYQRALGIRETQLGANHPDTATSLNNLALLYSSQGRYSEAEPLHQRALGIRGTQLGANHPATANSLNNLAALYDSQGRTSEAVSWLRRGVAVEEHNLAVNLAVGAEQQKRDYMRTISGTTDYAISLNLQGAPQNPQAGRLALTVILQRKGRILDVLGQNLQAIRQSLDPQDKKLLDDLTAVRSQLATLVYGGVGTTDPAVYRQQIQDLEAKSTQLEADLNNRSASFRQVSQPVTIEAVQRLIPQDAALVEFVVYRPFNPGSPPAPLQKGGAGEFKVPLVKGDLGASPPQAETWGKPRYAAYVLRATGEPQWVDLGEAAVIDAAIQPFKSAITDTSESLAKVKQVSRQLDALLMQPIRPLLGNSTTLLLSPDSQLNLIPFGALVDQQNRWLIETYNLVYLSSGRDLLRFQAPLPSRQSPLVLANPDYNLTTQVASAAGTGQNQRSVDLATLSFSNLVFTQAEGEAISRILPKARLLTGAQATEAAVSQVQGATILHIATHGFFLPDTPDARGDDRPGAPTQPVRTENPLVRSGLALAGANRRQGAGGDGVLTALEVTALNLFGTKLVVLSACDTGKGAVANGEGVYGLRRSFVLAGAESLMMTLWSVNDEATQALMVEYYGNLQRGVGRAEALRRVQLAMIKSSAYDHPLYWAAFVPSGNWAPMGL